MKMNRVLTKKEKLDALYDEFSEKFKNEMVVTGFGDSDAPVVLIGEAPGKDEVKYGRPFVGAAGKNLTELLAGGGIDRKDVFITNVVKYRLYKKNPKTGNLVNRPVTKDDLSNNLSYLMRELEILTPVLIVTLGNTALRAVCGNSIMISDVHGRVINSQSGDRRVFPLYHPASIIYNRSLKEVYENDVKQLQKTLKLLDF